MIDEMIDYDEEKDFSKRIVENCGELIKICNFEVGEKDDNCGAYERAKSWMPMQERCE